MKFKEARAKYIQAWGILGSQWGINKTMAQIHALLLICPEALSAEEIMSELAISRGNANMNIRSLMDWGIVSKEHRLGERKEYFTAEKDLWTLTKQVTSERRRREITPIVKMLELVGDIEDSNQSKEIKEFKEMTTKLKKFAKNADSSLAKMVQADEHWFWGSFMKIFK